MQSYKSMQIRSSPDLPLWKRIWGTDLWINKVPVVKTMIFVNVLVWLIK